MNRKGIMRVAALAVILSLLLIGCGSDPEEMQVSRKDSTKINIVATLFPQYDFARAIAGDKADVVLLMPPGVEAHSFEPTPSDIISINNSDLFLYTGKYMEVWSDRIIQGMDKSKSVVVDVSEGIDLVKTEDIEAEHEHEHEDLAENDEEEGEEHEHEHVYDPHIWTSPVIAKAMVNNILNAICRIDPDNAEYYSDNAEKYLGELDQLDKEFRDIVKQGKRNELIFGSRFALYYFAHEYGLDYEAAFDSCSTETEPSAKTVAHLIEEIKEEKIPVIYYAEIAEPKVAKSISEETGAEMLLFHSCHNVTREEMKQGATYLSLMRQNADNLREGLK